MSLQGKRNSQILDVLFTYRKVDDLQQYLQDNPNINILQLIDSQGNTVLHQLAYEGHLQLIKTFVRKVSLKLKKLSSPDIRSSKEENKKQIRNWINQRNNQGFTSLLYAAYSGHLDIIKYLVEEYHADFKIKTNTGLNPLHLSAQKNMVMPFLYFRNRIDLYQLDDLNSTVLHWAAYTNSEEVVSYILSQSDQLEPLNIRDSQGNTALMLAVTYGNTRIVRRLLIKGVNRYIKNNDGKYPLDVAIESQFNTIKKMLNENFSPLDFVKFYCNIKIQYKPKKRKYLVPTLFIISFLLNIFIVNFFISFNKPLFLYLQVTLLALTFLFYLLLLFQHPSNNPKNIQNFLDQYNERTIKKICFICKDKIPKRGYHCDTCGVCIAQYDHHCTWINNCVGKKNIGKFIIFVTLLVVSLAFIGLMAVLVYIMLVNNDPFKFSQYFQLRYLYTTLLQRICLYLCFGVNLVTTVFIGPVTLLCIVQLRNLLTNKTTFQKLKSPNQDQQIKNKIRKQSKVSLRNCRVMICADNRASFTTNKSSFSELITAQKYPSQRQQLHDPLRD